jgi:hypothetical protein
VPSYGCIEDPTGKKKYIANAEFDNMPNGQCFTLDDYVTTDNKVVNGAEFFRKIGRNLKGYILYVSCDESIVEDCSGSTIYKGNSASGIVFVDNKFCSLENRKNKE